MTEIIREIKKQTAERKGNLTSWNIRWHDINKNTTPAVGADERVMAYSDTVKYAG